MQYWWRCDINSSAAELIFVAQLPALQIAELLLVNSDSVDSGRRTGDSNLGHQSFRSTELTNINLQHAKL